MIICCSASTKYIYHLCCLIQSINANSPWCDVVARLINCSDTDIDRIRDLFPRVTVMVERYDCSTKRDKLLKNGSVLQDTMFDTYSKTRSKFQGARWLYSEFNARCINDRYNVIADLLRQGHDHVMSIDADMIVRRDLTDMVADGINADISLHAEIVKDGMPVDFGNIIGITDIPVMTRSDYLLKESTHPPIDYIEWHTGVVVFNNNTTTMKFVEDYAETLNSYDNIYTWGAEEEEIYFMFIEKYHDSLKIFNLPVKYKDEGYGMARIVGSNEYSDESYIWVGAGQNKYNAETLYVKELSKYECSDIVC